MADSNIEDRIASLTAQRDESTSAREAVIQENNNLQDRIRRLETQLAGITAPRSEGPSDDEVKSVLTGTGDSARRAPSKRIEAGDIQSIVQGVVQEALKPIVQRFAADDAATALGNAHAASFAKAAKEIPEILNKDSEVARIADQIFSGRPDLRSAADGPRLAAYVAKALVADTARSTKAEASRKSAATIPARPHSPSPELQDDMAERAELASKTREEVLSRGALTANEGVDATAKLFRAKLTELMAASPE